MNAAAKNFAAVAVAHTAIVLVTWTAGVARPEVVLSLSADDAAFCARNAMNCNAAKIALEDEARAALAHLPEIAAQVPRTARITCQVKRLHGERAYAVLAAVNAIEVAYETDEPAPGQRAAADAALIDAYLAP